MLMPRPDPQLARRLPDRRRIRPVRLADVPLEQRLKAARVACRHENNRETRLEILAAAYEPSSRTYWVAR